MGSPSISHPRAGDEVGATFFIAQGYLPMETPWIVVRLTKGTEVKHPVQVSLHYTAATWQAVFTNLEAGETYSLELLDAHGVADTNRVIARQRGYSGTTVDWPTSNGVNQSFTAYGNTSQSSISGTMTNSSNTRSGMPSYGPDAQGNWGLTFMMVPSGANYTLSVSGANPINGLTVN